MFLKHPLSPLNISNNKGNNSYININNSHNYNSNNNISTLFSNDRKPIILPSPMFHYPRPKISYLNTNLRSPNNILSHLSLNSSCKSISPLNITESYTKLPTYHTKFNNHNNDDRTTIKESQSYAIYPNISREHTIEEDMKRKNNFRILRSRRPPVEYSPDFYKEGGLISGSSNIMRKQTISLLKKSSLDTLNIRLKLLDTKKLWSNRVKDEVLIKDCQYVLKLKP